MPRLLLEGVHLKSTEDTKVAIPMAGRAIFTVPEPGFVPIFQDEVVRWYTCRTTRPTTFDKRWPYNRASTVYSTVQGSSTARCSPKTVRSASSAIVQNG